MGEVGRSTCHPQLWGDHHTVAGISRGDVRVTDRQVRPNVQSEESLSFGVSEAYKLRRGAGDPGGRGQGTRGSADKREGDTDRQTCRQLNSEVPTVACNVGRSHPIKSLDETDTNGQQPSIKTGKTFFFFKIFMKPNEAGSCGCDLLHRGKPEQPHDPFAFTPDKSLASGLPKGLSAALPRRKKTQLLRRARPFALLTFSFALKDILLSFWSTVSS